MTKEEKAKAYDEALEYAHYLINERCKEGTDGSFHRADLQKMFPELQESEDEMIRKEIISALKYANHKGVYDKHLAWLEKQGEHANFLSKIQVGDKVTRNEAGILVNLSQLERIAKPRKAKSADKVELEKQGEKTQGKSALEAAKEEKVNNSNKVEPKFKESDWITNGENTIQITMVDTKSGHSGYYRCFEGSHGFGWYVIDIESANKDYHLWTIADAKDGDVLVNDEGKPFIFKGLLDANYPNCPVAYGGVCINCDDVEAFCISERCHWWCDLIGVKPATREQRELLFSKIKEAGYEWDSEKKELRKIEQRLAEKVEPRFKVGDFIVNNNSKDVYQVTEIRDDEYCLWPLYAEIKGYLRINDVDNEYHLWSIKDAKDGDVLVYNNIATEIIMLFRCKAINKPRAYTHFHIFDNDFRVNGCCVCGNDARPATKEQRNHLFQKIKEVGYKWDSNAKELKKIETVDIPFNAKDSELIEATYFIPEGFHTEIEDGKVIIKKGKQKPADTDNKFIKMRETKPKDISEFLDRLTTVEQEFLWEHIAKIRELDKEEQKSS